MSISFSIPTTEIKFGDIISFVSLTDYTGSCHKLPHYIGVDNLKISYFVVSIRPNPKKGIFLYLSHAVPYVLAF